jgi:iron(III) transport system ATP-binding protein
MAELRVDDLVLRDGDNEILRGVSLRVPPGKVAAVLGPSRSGKRALLRAIAGLQTPQRGSIRVGDKVLFDSVGKIDLPAEARGLGVVLRTYALWPDRSVFDNIAYGLKVRAMGPPEIATRLEHTLAQIGLADLTDRYPGQLSNEQQQRVALARALVYQPAALLLEEPLSSLEGELRDAARGWLRQITVSLDLPTLLVTRDQIEATALADRITLLEHGLVEQEGTSFDLYERPATLFAAEFMGKNNRLVGTLLESTGGRAVMDVDGTRLEGIARTRAQAGEKATGVIRLHKVLLGGGPGPNRIHMRLATQMYVGERWELVFTRDDLTVRAYVSTPLRHELYHVEFPPDALWIF